MSANHISPPGSDDFCHAKKPVERAARHPSVNLNLTARSELDAYLRDVEAELQNLRSLYPSEKCVALRILQAFYALQLIGFNEHVADAAANAAAKGALEAIESGTVWDQADRGAWFWTCALNYAARFAKCERGYVSLDTENICEMDCRLDPETLVAMRPHLRNALRGLPRQHRIAVLRRYVGGYAINAVARKLKVGFRRVKCLLREGRAHLRRTLLPAWQAQFDA